MNNREKMELLKQLHNAFGDQLNSCIEDDMDYTELENMPIYTIGIGGKVFSFPATIVYRYAFDMLFSGWDELKDALLAGVEGSEDLGDGLQDEHLGELWDTLEDTDSDN